MPKVKWIFLLLDLSLLLGYYAVCIWQMLKRASGRRTKRLP